MSSDGYWCEKGCGKTVFKEYYRYENGKYLYVCAICGKRYIKDGRHVKECDKKEKIRKVGDRVR